MRGPKLVAIKTLKSSATEKEEVMFLQEAAINGQFHHRNVVKLCGVVTVGHPVSRPSSVFIHSLSLSIFFSFIFLLLIFFLNFRTHHVA